MYVLFFSIKVQERVFTINFPTVFKLCRHRVNASSNFAAVTFFTVFKMYRHRVNAVSIGCQVRFVFDIIIFMQNSAVIIVSIHFHLTSIFGWTLHQRDNRMSCLHVFQAGSFSSKGIVGLIEDCLEGRKSCGNLGHYHAFPCSANRRLAN